MYVRNRRETMWWTLACRGVKNEIVYRLIDDENKYTHEPHAYVSFIL